MCSTGTCVFNLREVFDKQDKWISLIIVCFLKGFFFQITRLLLQKWDFKYNDLAEISWNNLATVNQLKFKSQLTS